MEAYLSLQDDIIIEISTVKKDEKDERVVFKDYSEFQKKLESRMVAEEISLDDFFESNYNDDIENKTLNTYHIKHWVSNRSFGELIDMYEEGEIKIPDMQRSFVWDSLKSSRLIESIILGLPIPAMFLMETENNTYELIDGVQRLTSLTNFVNGRPWNYDEDSNKRVIPSKLSQKVVKEIANKTFEQLPKELQRRILRSTIPLIEFRQMEPDNYESKFLIFERINSGSITLTSMQIRHSLFYGEFMTCLYKNVRSSESIKKLFTSNKIKNDSDVEAILRIFCFYSYYYKNEIELDSGNIKSHLNNFCQKKRNQKFDNHLFERINQTLTFLSQIFGDKAVFRNAKRENEHNICFKGGVNIAIMEALVSAVINSLPEILDFTKIDTRKLIKAYQEEFIKLEDGVPNENPFRYSTGKKEKIDERFKICEKIVQESLVD